MKTRNTRNARHGMGTLLLAAAATGAHALPASPSVVSGQASFNQAGSVFSITNTPGAIIQWQSFSIGAGETTRFLQQNASSAVLNRIVGQDPSQILGTLQSNGRVFLVNPNGVLFGAGSRVDVNGLVASSLAISNQDFLAGKMNFTAGATAGAVSNAGAISTPGGGSVYLIAPNVTNTGFIQSPGGQVVLAAGRTVQLVDSASPNLHVVVSAPQDQAMNLGKILAQGGSVGIYGGLVNQRGWVSADSAVVGANGRIVFKASGDLLLEAGSVTSATGAGTGGSIQLDGDRVGLTGNARVDASGLSGGGIVQVGTGGAQQVLMGADAVIRADAIQSGDGGKVTLLSQGLTRVLGSISARGGDVSGDGGFVETSGRQLSMQGRVDTRAPHGRTGTLLLDPTNIFIANDQASATAAGMTGADVVTDTFMAAGAVSDSLLTVSTLQGVLATSIVSVSTENAAGTGAGFIRVVDPVSWTGDTILTLLANAGIQITAPITNVGGGTLALHTTSGDIVQSAAISVSRLSAHADSGSVNFANAGNQVGQVAGFAGGAGGFNYANGAAPLVIGTVGGPLTDSGAVSLSTGPININTAGDLTLQANVSSAAGNIVISAGGIFDNQATVASASGGITLQGVVVQAPLVVPPVVPPVLPPPVPPVVAPAPPPIAPPSSVPSAILLASPVGQAINTTMNLINSVTTTVKAPSFPAKSSDSSAATSGSADSKPAAASTAKTDPPPAKMYCN